MRKENEDVSHLNLDDPKRIENIYIDSNGNRQSILENNVCIKISKSLDSDFEMYYAKQCDNKLFNPNDTDIGYKKKKWIFKKVNKECFSNYKSFLTTKRKAFLYQAERNI